MPKVKLTDAAVQRFKAGPGERADYFDASLGGFGLRVAGPPLGHSANNPCRKSWFLFYRFRGRQRRLTFEPPYPALSLIDARKKAGAALALLPESDPAAVKAAAKQRDGDTVKKIIADFIRARTAPRARKKWSTRYAEEIIRNFENHVLPRWHSRTLREISRRDINELLDAVAEDGSTVKNAEGEKRLVPGGPIAANRVLAAVRALFNWAISRGVIESTPATQIEPRGEETQRDRALSDDEVRFLWPQFEARGYPFGHFYRLALLTGQRRDEVAGMRLDEIDEAKSLWTLSGERTKSGRPHIVPLSEESLDIVRDAIKTAGAIARTKGMKPGQFVFTTAIETAISGYSRAKANLDRDIAVSRKNLKLPNIPAWTIHDLRRTCATGMAALGVDRFVIGRVLNHADRGVTGIYDRYTYLDEKRRALRLWETHLQNLTQQAASTVVRFSRGKSANL